MWSSRQRDLLHVSQYTKNKNKKPDNLVRIVTVIIEQNNHPPGYIKRPHFILEPVF